MGQGQLRGTGRGGYDRGMGPTAESEDWSERQRRSYQAGNQEATDNLNFAKIKHRRLRKNKAARTNTNFDTYDNLRPSSEAFLAAESSSDYDKYGVEMQGQMDYPVSDRNSKSRFQQFDEPHPEEHKPDEHKPEQTHQMLDEVKKLEEEIRKLEQTERAAAAGKPPNPNTTIRANISFPLKWKQYRNLSDGNHHI